MRVGIIGTGAIARKHAQAYKNIGYQVTACANHNEARGREFAAETGAEYVATVEDLCRHPRVDYVDLCTFPDYRLQAVRLCAETGKHILVQKPMATDPAIARQMIEISRQAGIQLGVVSQHRFDDATIFLKQAIQQGRLGRIIQADAYVKWWRPGEYYRRPIKGSWATEGGGALINQGIHQIDLLLYLAGPVEQTFGYWQLGAVHKIESEDNLCALLKYANGANGVIQASTALWPGYAERLEIHGTRGTAIVAGDKLTRWDVRDDAGEDAPVASEAASGASDPMAISVLPFERQLLDFGAACQTGRRPLSAGEDGYRALQVVSAIYASCRYGKPVDIADGL
jgi:UDP-N-acetyl-2-amino-2-deoxyglucuronate dehydrogenase